jgi:hypothetical protein
MAPKLAKGMDPLGDLPSDEEELSDSGEGGAGGAGDAGPAAPPQPKPKVAEVDFETLQRAGYRRCAPCRARCAPAACRNALAAPWQTNPTVCTCTVVRVPPALTRRRARALPRRSGPSVLYIPEQKPAAEANWSWCELRRALLGASPRTAPCC